MQKIAAYLGINARTESSHERRGLQRTENNKNLVTEVDTYTGEIITFDLSTSEKKRHKSQVENRAERYALKSVVNGIFPTSRTAKCHRMKIPRLHVQILKNAEFNRAHYAGLTVCSSVWWCPLCAAKISERRRSELVTATLTAEMLDWQVFLMTCTIPHGLGDDITEMLNKMLKAWRTITTGRAGKELNKRLGMKGTIRALEVTDGVNGFHPHFHILIFADKTHIKDEFQAGFLPLWKKSCVKAGLPCPSDEHGLRVDDGSKAAKYATKWGLEEEMTKSHTKHGKDGGMTPWDMLRDVLNNDSERSKKRFFIYANAFKGRRQLYWSNGLKEKLNIEETTDEELAALQEEHSTILAQLTTEQWRAVLKRCCEAGLLTMAENNPLDIPEFLKTLEENYTKNKKS